MRQCCRMSWTPLALLLRCLVLQVWMLQRCRMSQTPLALLLRCLVLQVWMLQRCRMSRTPLALLLMRHTPSLAAATHLHHGIMSCGGHQLACGTPAGMG